MDDWSLLMKFITEIDERKEAEEDTKLWKTALKLAKILEGVSYVYWTVERLQEFRV